MPARYSIWAVLLLVAAPSAAQQPAQPQAPATAQQPATASRGYTVFVGGTVIGREDVTVQTSAGGFTISAKGRLTGSQDVVIRRVEVRYRADGTAEAYELEASVNGGETALQTTFAGGTAVTTGVDGGDRVAQTDQAPAQIVVLPNVFFGSYEALARRLAKAEPGQDFPVFIGAGALGSIRVVNSDTERVQVGTSSFTLRRYGMALTGPRGQVPMIVYTDEQGSLVRVSVPGQSVEVMRDDLASATARTVTHANPTDEAVNIPATGFNLGATLTLPRATAGGAAAIPARAPAVILLASAAANDRDGMVGGIPILGQLAGALADAGVVAVRYDKRGHGQSGGRAESATLGDHAEDALAVVRWLRTRRDVDPDRIAIIGHNEGAWSALLAATKERRIAAIVSVAAPSTPGAERVLEQQRHVLERMNIPPAERVAKIELQSRIHTAVASGRGWEELPADVRKAADTPWFQSMLAFNPARVLEDVRQPVLFIHGDLDGEVPVSHVDQLSELARTKGRSRAVAVVTVRGVNHALVPAITGDVREYAVLQDRQVSAEAARAITDWITKTLRAVR
jgi:pimeloyl-ACP methyl ester carboxylesterase